MITKLLIHGVGISIEAEEEISSWLNHDYIRYIKPELEPDAVKLKFKLIEEQPNYSDLPELIASTYHNDYIVYENKSSRIIDFFGQALAIYNLSGRLKSVEIQSSTRSKLYEIFCLAFETLLGDELDKIGWHRIHCLALEKDGEGTVVLLPPGAGKTTLAMKFLENTRVKILAEDLAIIKNGELRSLHFRWGTRDLETDLDGRLAESGHSPTKKLFNPDPAELAVSARPKNLIMGKRISSARSEIKNISKIKIIIPLFKSMVLGLELQQALAFFILRNFKDGFFKFSLSFSRLTAMIKLIMKCQTYEFLIGNDIEKNYETLSSFVQPKKL
ncbi:MAG: hypothetical protein Q7K65_04140 [Candidatus Buchananbacteria bacterium]|nr:hypothetical protein [Candidatus Buchananbacteria bacterium]